MANAVAQLLCVGSRISEGHCLVIGKPIALIQIPNQRLFSVSAAARYLGIDADTLRKIDATELPVKEFRGRRTYRLEDLDRLIESLLAWKNGAGENPLPFPHKKKGA
jgi:Helix-turn-helix domain